jgi:hypothetical protein
MERRGIGRPRSGYCGDGATEEATGRGAVVGVSTDGASSAAHDGRCSRRALSQTCGKERQRMGKKHEGIDGRTFVNPAKSSMQVISMSRLFG